MARNHLLDFTRSSHAAIIKLFLSWTLRYYKEQGLGFDEISQPLMSDFLGFFLKNKNDFQKNLTSRSSCQSFELGHKWMCEKSKPCNYWTRQLLRDSIIAL